MGLKKPSDEVGIGVKGQSSPEIAGSPRNILRYVPVLGPPEVEHRMG